MLFNGCNIACTHRDCHALHAVATCERSSLHDEWFCYALCSKTNHHTIRQECQGMRRMHYACNGIYAVCSYINQKSSHITCYKYFANASDTIKNHGHHNNHTSNRYINISRLSQTLNLNRSIQIKCISR